jgi:hypothetical protein
MKTDLEENSIMMNFIACILHLVLLEVKVKLSLCLTKHHTMKTLGTGGTAPRILDLDPRWK